MTKGAAPMLSLGVDGNNRIINTGFSYDYSGNVLSDGANTYAYDAEGRMKTGAGVTYTYDGDGERVKKSSGSLYWYDLSGNVLMETNLSGQALQVFVYFGGRKVSTTDAWSGLAHYYFTDALGSTNVVTNADGTVIEEESDFYPFGGERVLTHSLWYQHYKFTGKERDAESGLDYFGARHYSSALGRFLQPDEFPGGPVDAFSSNDPAPPGALPYADITNPQSLNKYSYTYSNPLRYTDPNGHDGWDFLLGVGNAVGSNFALGAGRQEPYNSDNANGQAVGDVISVVGGAIETTYGGGLAAPGVAACGTGAGCVVGAPAAAVGVGIALHGVGEASVAISHLASNTNPQGGGDSSPYKKTPENKEKMEAGKAPTGKDGHPVELHHDQNNPKAPVKEMTRTDHRLGENFKKNHPNTGQEPSKINPNERAKIRRKHWKQEAKE